MKTLTAVSLMAALGCTSQEGVADVESPEEPPVSRPSGFERVGDRYVGRVTNPTSGVDLSVVVDIPVGEGPWPLVVHVPGGMMSGSDALPENQRSDWMEAGFALATWDPDGRGDSSGTENGGGRVHQDGLAAVLEATSMLPVVDADRVGLVSFSYGVVMATGMLSRHDTRARFFVDWEGPASRWDVVGCAPDIPMPPDATGARGGAAPDVSCEDETYWTEREAVRAVALLQVPYHRIQFAEDHKQPDTEHGIQMIEAAIRGGVAEVWYNDQRVRSVDDVLVDLSGQRRNEAVIRYSLARMEAVSDTPVLSGGVPTHLEGLEPSAPGTAPSDRPRRRAKRR